jgi:hypothetical protein
MVYWFVWVMGTAEVKGKRVVDLKMGSITRDKVQDKYTQYWSFFRRPKETTTKAASAEKVPAVVDTFYNLVAEGRRWVGLEVATRQSSDSAPVAPPSPPPHQSARRQIWTEAGGGSMNTWESGDQARVLRVVEERRREGRREDERGWAIHACRPLPLAPRR